MRFTLKQTTARPVTHLAARPAGGFALVISLTLMAFVVLLVISLSSIAQIQLRLSGMQKDQLQAQQHALMSLRLALGELQSSMGPDQRVSAPAELLADADAQRQHFVGVWSSADLPQLGLTEGQLLQWLASDASTENGAPVADYHCQPRPAPDSSVVLLGPGSLPASNGVLDDLDTGIRIALKPIRQGLSDAVNGRYAWWIGDEGIKARINLGAPAASSVAGNQLKFDTVNSVSAFAQSKPSNLPNLESVDFEADAERIQELPHLAILAQGAQEVHKSYFHHLTTASLGVLADVKNGGLKKDLSLAFEMDAADFNQSTFAAGGQDPFEPWPGAGFKVQPIFQFDSEAYPGASFAGTANGPAWHLLRDYYRIYRELQNPMTDPSFEARALGPNFNHRRYDLPGVSPTAGIYQPAYLYAGGRSLVTNPQPSHSDNGSGSPDDIITISAPAADAPMLQAGPEFDPLRSRGSQIPTMVSGNYLPIMIRQVINLGVYARQLPAWKTANEYQFIPRIQSVFTLHNPFNVKLRHSEIALESESFHAYFDLYYEDSGQHVLTGQPGDANRLAAMNDVEGARISTRAIVAADTIDPGLIRMYPGSDMGVTSAAVDPIDSWNGNWTSLRMGLLTPISERFPALDQDGNPSNFFTLVARPSHDNNRLQENQKFSLRHAYSIVPINSRLLLRENGAAASNESQSPEWSLASSFSSLVVGPGRDYDDHIASNPAMEVTGRFRFPTDAAFTGNGAPPAWKYGFALDFDLTQYSANAPRPVITLDLQLKPSAYFNLNGDRLRYPVYAMTNPLAPVKDSRGFLPATEIRSRADKTSRDGFPTFSPGWDVNISQGSALQNVNYRRWGATDGGLTAISGSSLNNPVVLELPTTPIASLGRLQHANLSLYDHMPALAVGNSFASPFIPRDRVYSVNPNRYEQQRIFYDISYLLNEALWDGYFFSSYSLPYLADADRYEENRGVRGSFQDAFGPNATTTLPNPRMHLHPHAAESLESIQEKLFRNNDPAPDSYARAAENLMLKGAFNVNSTSVAAWRTLLSGARDRAVYLSGQSSATQPSPASTPFLRLSQPTQAEMTGTSLIGDEAWGGFRSLQDAQITRLAENIVAEIKQRATLTGRPIISLAEFVNRRLSNDASGLAGILQTAIDRAGSAINAELEDDSRIDPSFLDGSAASSGTRFPYPDNLQRADGRPASAAPASPGYLLQADILQAIGSFLSARSDTFRIRAYGESIDPNTGQLRSKAWCEALVQRVPRPVNPPAGSSPADPEFWSAPDAAGTPANFGRQFKIVSFRWLSEDEI